MSETCSGIPSEKNEAEIEMEEMELQERMERIARKFIVLSGKGGVGKSTVAVNLAVAFAMKGMKTGLLDIDLHGPSIPGMMGLKGIQLVSDEDGIIQPYEVDKRLKVVSIGLMIGSEKDAVIWRGPMKYGVIKQLLKDVNWGELDCLVIDSPPGTGDEPLSVAQLAGKNSSAVVVTTPQSVAIDDVRRSVSFCEKLSLPVAGIIENMSGYSCPHCGNLSSLFSSGGGEKLAAETNVPFLGKIPITPEIVSCGDSGKVFIENFSYTPATDAFDKIVDALLNGKEKNNNPIKENSKMKIAIPTAGKKLCMHFGHCEEFAVIDVDNSKKIVKTEYVIPPPHEPGLLPKWLHEMGVNVIIAGGMGQRAQSLFAENSIQIVAGAPSESPDALVGKFLNGTLETGANACDH